MIATGIRALIHLSAVKGGKTGPAMNPMIATAWVRERLALVLHMI